MNSFPSPLSNYKASQNPEHYLGAILTDEQELKFEDRVKQFEVNGLTPNQLEVLQVNMGYRCNQSCNHCHVDAGPTRKEQVSFEVLEACLNVVRTTNVKTVDITGGAPEMHPRFEWFVEALSMLDVEIIVRSNLTIIVANKKYHQLPDFFKRNKVRVIASLPFYTKERTDRQRGKGVYESSIKALKMLNAVGYGLEHLKLDLVYNPSGAYLPDNQASLELQFKKELLERHGIEFNELLSITNLPISRYLDFLIESGNVEEYMLKLVDAFNPSTLNGVMCKNTLSVDWEGYLYDCDFNQMLKLKLNAPKLKHIFKFDELQLQKRKIVTGQHCYGCTAGSGSSCQGAVL